MSTKRLTRAEQARRGFDPNAGMVHMVVPNQNLLHTDDHVMKDIYEDSNQGVNHLLKKRSGPFRNEKGASRIMSRSAHVIIRKRGIQLEITIKRGVTLVELNNLQAKLHAHGHRSPQSMLFFVTTGRKKIGTLIQIDMQALMDMIHTKLMHRKTVGLLLIGTQNTGPMYKPHIHGGKFTRHSYSGDTIHHT